MRGSGYSAEGDGLEPEARAERMSREGADTVSRIGKAERTTKESCVEVEVDLDGAGRVDRKSVV